MSPALAVAAALALTASAAAHDFWIDLGAWRQDEPGGAIALALLVGTSAERESWRMRPERVVSLRSIGPAGITDHALSIRAGTDADPGGAAIRLAEPGTHIVAFETTPAESDLPAKEFDDYVAHEELTLVAAHRAGRAAGNGRELYARRAKALVQIGERATANVTRPIGQSLEIVPLANPYAAGVTMLPVEIRFRGAPLAGVRVELENLADPRSVPVTVHTGPDGRAIVPFRRSGAWKVRTIWSVPIEDTRRADYDTLFASLTFGF